LADSALPPGAKVREIIDRFIGPILENDGGYLELVRFDEDSGTVDVRFVGSCANCPCSMLSLETIVTPPLLQVPGVRRVQHRGRLRDGELDRATSLDRAPSRRLTLPIVQ
jgi:Fe-S cluster biogenesis protein NfuA